jgi:hypothetical protein
MRQKRIASRPQPTLAAAAMFRLPESRPASPSTAVRAIAPAEPLQRFAAATYPEETQEPAVGGEPRCHFPVRSGTRHTVRCSGSVRGLSTARRSRPVAPK